MGDRAFDGYSVRNKNKLIDVPEGMVILKEGEVNLDMYKLVEGNVEMYVGYGTEDEILVGILGPGACFGEFGLLLKKPAIYTIVSFSPVKIIRVTEGTMGDFVAENHDCIVRMMKNMAGMMLNMTLNIQQLRQELDEKDAQLSEGVSVKQSSSELAQAEMKDALRKYAIKGYAFMGKKT